MDVNWVRVTVLVGVFALSGCGGGSAPHLVRAHGQLVRVGGPAPGGAVMLGGVHLRFEGMGTSDTVRTGPDGRFVFDLAPGAYRVTITSGGPQADGHPMQPFPKVVQVPHAGHLRLVVNIR
jgi:hypothetical protein